MDEDQAGKKKFGRAAKQGGGWEGAASSRGSRLRALWAGVNVSARECECVLCAPGQRVESSGAGSHCCPRPPGRLGRTRRDLVAGAGGGGVCVWQ